MLFNFLAHPSPTQDFEGTVDLHEAHGQRYRYWCRVGEYERPDCEDAYKVGDKVILN